MLTPTGPGLSGFQDDAAVSAAADELTNLIDSLINATFDARGHSSSAFVTLQKDSAAARFLQRVKAAEFSARDARKIRLVDFGRRLE